MEPRNYPAKVLLYGEHTVLRGGRGLAVPYPPFSLRWTSGAPDPRLQSFAEWLRARPELAVDAERLLADLEPGRRLAGDIPTGYGLGSSGAVCAAIWDEYRIPTKGDPPLADLRTSLAKLEAFFHGSSSGTDPLISYLRQPVVLEAGGAAGAASLPGSWADGFFLLDTGRERSASPLIQRFLATWDRDPAPIVSDWREPADAAIAALLSGDREELHRCTAAISEFQLARFPDFIPEAFHAVWNGGEDYRLKLCGAGGGGMLLGLARDREATASQFGDQAIWLA
ncbi:hypothetical protein [Lewinella sp. IMCC34183]|uniref:GHMP family kinase ATP-binding protein n=1 Tax=Lewinella sp. IMCC34183 TaxID=2248762 RepID=UPI000E23AC84|nr:hypothetical protein [Lewinella sp. IMCC34183]